MLLLLFLMVISAVNLSVGYAAAVYLGVATWPPKLDFGRKEAEPDEVFTEYVPEPTSTPPAVQHTPAEAVAEDEEAPAPEHPLAALLEQLARGFDRFEAELAHWDNRRREETLDADALTNSAIELNSLAAGYLEQLQASVAPLAAQRLAGPAALRAREKVNSAAAELSQQLSVICAELGSLQFEASDAHLAAEKLTTALTQVLGLLHTARDVLEEPLVELLGSAVHEPALVASLTENAHTSLLGRLCFEHIWQNSEMLRMSGEIGAVALLDVDSLKQINAAHGPLLARRALTAIDKIAREGAGIDITVVRLRGQQFLLSLPQQAPQAAAETIEQIRQQIEHTRLRCGALELTLTVSAAVVVAETDDTPPSVLERLRTTVREAKSYGRNRTFLWEASAPTPVLPPELNIEPRLMEL